MDKPDNTSKNLILNLETLGNSYDSIILQAGMCYFNESSILSTMCININPTDQKSYGSTSDINILTWWKQPENINIYKKFFENSHNVEDALDFIDWFIQDEVNVFCQCAFDYPILKSLYDRAYRDCPIKPLLLKDIPTLLSYPISAYMNYDKSFNTLDNCRNQVKILQSLNV